LMNLSFSKTGCPWRGSCSGSLAGMVLVRVSQSRDTSVKLNTCWGGGWHSTGDFDGYFFFGGWRVVVVN
jgi:hypothetical protein